MRRGNGLSCMDQSDPTGHTALPPSSSRDHVSVFNTKRKGNQKLAPHLRNFGYCHFAVREKKIHKVTKKTAQLKSHAKQRKACEISYHGRDKTRATHVLAKRSRAPCLLMKVLLPKSHAKTQ